MRNAMMSIVSAVALTSGPAWADFRPAPAELVADVCPGDLNGDEVVNSADLAVILGSYGKCRQCDEDLNHDGYVDETDVKMLALRWGPCSSDEDVIKKSIRTAAGVSDDPEIYEGYVGTNDGAFSDGAEVSSIAEQTTCEGDLDRNGRIDSIDLAFVLGRHGPCKGCEEDLNGDGFVDEKDVDILVDIWGECPKQKQVSRALAATGGDEVEADLPRQNPPEEEEPQCPGDLDGNGTIDSTDLALLLTHYGRCNDCDADMTADGYVDQDDIDALMASWGTCPEDAFSSTSPKGKAKGNLKTLAGG